MSCPEAQVILHKKVCYTLQAADPKEIALHAVRLYHVVCQCDSPYTALMERSPGTGTESQKSRPEVPF